MPSPFSILGLRPELLQSLEQVGYVEMTPIQAEALPLMLEGADVVGRAKTGSGKTAAFGLAVLQGVDPDHPVTQALVLCPTRELAEQVAGELRRLAQRMANTRVLTVCGGRPFRDQAQALRRGSQVVVGTPGRVAEHLRRGIFDTSHMGMLVLDEADRMLDMGFMEEVQGIISQCPPRRQTLLFSATFPDEIEALSEAVQRKPVTVEVETQVESELLQQVVYEGLWGERRQLVLSVLARYRPAAALVFCETRDDCDTLAAFLSDQGAVALPLHGLMEQRDREDVLLQFSNGSASVLVATNVAARGLDIASLPLVVVSELSPDPESHLHRIGRTGRAGESGLAVSIVTGDKELARLAKIEAYLGHELERGALLLPGGSLEFMTPPNRTLLLTAGRKDKLRKGDVLGALVKDGKIPVEAIGRIDLRDRTCAVAIARTHAVAALRYVERGRIKKYRVRALLMGSDRD